MDVLYTINKNYLDIMLASFLSLKETSDFPFIRLHVVTSDFKREDYERLEQCVSKLSKVELFIYPLEDFNIASYNIPEWRGSQIANSRLFFQSILDKNLGNMSHLLYLDADTIVVDELKGLVEYDDNMISLVKDSCLKKRGRRLANLEKYFNSGVIYFNVEEWIKNSSEEKIINFIKTSDTRFHFPDQDILNCALNTDISELSFDYNMPPYSFIFSSIFSKMFYNGKYRNVESKEVEEALRHPHILHSYGLVGMKPWMKNNTNPFNTEFMHYIKKVNPNFELEKMSMTKEFLSYNKYLLYLALIATTYAPDNVDDAIKHLALKAQEKK